MRKLIGLAIALGALCIPAGAGAYTLRMTENGRPVRWKSTTIPFRVDQSLADIGDPADVKRAIVSGFQAWGAIPGSPFVFQGDGSPIGRLGFGDRNDGTTDIVLVKSAWEYDPTFLGLTLVTYEPDTGRISDADIMLNGDLFHFGIAPPSDVGYDLENVFTHELGHLLGFGHSAIEAATMFASSRPGETAKRDLDTDDEEGFFVLYLGDGLDGAGASCSVGGHHKSVGFGILLAVGVGLALLRRRPRVAASLLAGLVVLGSGLQAHAALVEYQTPAQLAQKASVVFRGIVQSRHARREGALIVTDVTLRVEDCWKGDCQRGSVVVAELGGEVDGVGLLAPEDSPLVMGAEIVVFAAERAGTLRLVGGVQGAFELDPATEIASRDLTSVTAPQGVRLDGVLSLRQLRRTVRGAVNR